MSGKRILVIDDDALVVKTLKNLLSKKGYDVTLAHNAVDAVSEVAVRDFDLVISDIRMPGENGIIAIEKIKKIYQERKVVCGYIFLSGYAEEDTPAHAIRLGVDKFIYKPFDNDYLLKSIEEELELVRSERELKASPEFAGPIIITKRKKGVIERRQVVITGIGCVTPGGIGREEYWKGLKEGRNCVDQITFFDPSSFPSQMAAEIKNFSPNDFISDYSEIRRMARSSHLAIAAAKLALDDSALAQREVKQLGIIIGSGTGGIEYIEPEMRALEWGGIKKVHPYAGIGGFSGAISSEVSRNLGLEGMSISISTGCTSATDALGYALNRIRYGDSEAILAGGTDACVAPSILAAFCQMGATSRRNHDLKKASRPFNQDRDGFVISEGSWIFLVEELEHALRRKAPIYGELAGYGISCDAFHMAKPHPSGQGSILAIKKALEDAALEPEEIDIFEAYGNSTPINDSYETGVVKKVFGKHAYKLLMPSVKSMLGHPIGASGGQQLAAVLLALNEGVLHPTINYENPDTHCDLDYVPNQPRVGSFKAALCNALAFGGKNAVIAVKKV